MTTYLFYHGPITIPGVKNVEILCNDAIINNVESLTLCMCSGGGDVTAGIGLYNFLRMIPLQINTHCFGVGGSIAATIFLAGRRRTAVPASYFMLHAAQYITGPNAGKVSDDNKFTTLPFRLCLGWGDDQINRYFTTADENLLSVKEAIALGICHEEVELKLGIEDTIINVSIPSP